MWIILALTLAVSQSACPTGWFSVPGGLCAVVSPATPHGPSTVARGVRRSAEKAEGLCGAWGAALPAAATAAAVAAVDAAVGGGGAWWLRPRRTDPRGPWITVGGRPDGTAFDWDVGEPRENASCVVQWPLGNGRTLGGRGTMKAVDCGERHVVVCEKPENEFRIESGKFGPLGTVEVVMGGHVLVSVWGQNFPVGMFATLQSDPAGEPLPCASITHTTGESAPIAATVVADPTPPPTAACTVPCMRATINVTSVHLRRGGTYAVCFFASVYFAAPLVPSEFAEEGGVKVKAVQSAESFQNDACDRAALIDALRTNPAAVQPTPLPPTETPFTADVEGGREL